MAISGIRVTIQEKGGNARDEVLEPSEVTVGRVQDNDIVLPKGNISKRHTRVLLRDGKLIVVDLKTTNGTWVNGKRISSPQVLRDGDKVAIGDFTLVFAPHDPAEWTGAARPSPSSPSSPSPSMRPTQDPLALVRLLARVLREPGTQALQLREGERPAVTTTGPSPVLDERVTRDVVDAILRVFQVAISDERPVFDGVSRVDPAWRITASMLAGDAQARFKRRTVVADDDADFDLIPRG